MSDLRVYRAANGQLVVSLANAVNKDLGSIGTVSGNIEFKLGATTDSSDETVLMISQNTEGQLNLKANDSFNHYELSGKNINADFNTTDDKSYSVLMDTVNSTLDASGSKNGIVLETTEDSSNNYIKLGASANTLLTQKTADGTTASFQNYVVDGGSNNTIDATKSNSTLFETTATSKGVIVDAANATNMFIVGGQNGVFSGGSGVDYFASESTSKGNVMSGNAGNDVLYESGSYNLFMGGLGTDTATMQGKYSIANLGFDEAGFASYENGSYKSAVFTGASATDSLGNVYKYAEYMKAGGWTLEQFLAKSGIAENPNYASIKDELTKIFQY